MRIDAVYILNTKGSIVIEKKFAAHSVRQVCDPLVPARLSRTTGLNG